MKTFVEYFENFKKECSYETLFFEDIVSDKEKKLERKIIIYITAIALVLFLILLYKTPIYLSLYTMLLSVVYLIYYLHDTKRKRNILTDKGLPIPLEYYKWKSKELEIMRLEKSYKAYEKINSTTISKLIEIVNNQLKKDYTESFIVFEKVAGYLGGNLFNFLLGFFMATIKTDLVKNFEYYLFFFIEIYLIQILIVVSYYFAKNGHLIDKKSNKRQLQDYIFVLENILLIKNSENKSKT